MSYLDTDDVARCWLADNAEHLGPEMKEILPEVYVWPAHMEQAYGGSEEGGWWYDRHSPITDPIREAAAKQSGYPAQPRCVRQMRLDLAQAYVRRANALAERFINAERPSYTSTRSQGVVVWVWTFDKPCNYPKERPRYE